MNIDDLNEKTVNAFIVSDTDEFTRYLNRITPVVLRKDSKDVGSLLGIRVRVSSHIPPNKIAVCDNTGIIGFLDMEPEPPEFA